MTARANGNDERELQTGTHTLFLRRDGLLREGGLWVLGTVRTTKSHAVARISSENRISYEDDTENERHENNKAAITRRKGEYLYEQTKRR